MNVKTLGIDIAKRVFYLHGEDERGQVVIHERLSRARISQYVANLPPCTVAMEACGSAHYWGRKFAKFGHRVRLINPKFVKPFVKTNKNDWHDAAAICEAAQRPTMRFVAVKSIMQQDILALHRIRQRRVVERTALANQIRGLLYEYGVIVARGLSTLRRQLPDVLEDGDNELTPGLRALLADLQDELRVLDQRIADLDAALLRICAEQPDCERLRQIPGIGPLTATAFVATVGSATLFKNGRHLAAFLGLVPRQHSTGGTSRLLGISKRGDTYLRTLLIHGARSTVHWANKKSDKRSEWIKKLVERRGKHRAMVAVANKNARIAWALLAEKEQYRIAA